MLTMNEFVDLRMQQQIAHEIYRQQIMQRIPDPFPPMLPLPVPHHIIMPPRPTLPGVQAKLENNDLWKQFHKIGTEMIITKSGRRMFPSMRISLSGLDEESNYCVLLEMVPIGDCRYKFSGSQWVPAGGAEPQSPQRMFLHADSPATGAHWQAQAILFNKVKLTNNTLDSNGHIVLASMHKYQPRLHIIRTSDLTQLPWAPQQAFVFPETEFVAVTAYQNDRITKLKIDNNPFAKGFRESGQSRCKRKLSALNEEQTEQNSEQQQPQQQQISLTESPNKSSSSLINGDDDRCSSISSAELNGQIVKRFRSTGSIDDDACSSTGTISPGLNYNHHNHNHHHHHQLQHTATTSSSALQFYHQQHHHHHHYQHQHQHQQHHQQHHQHSLQEQQQRVAALQLHHQSTAMDLAAAAYFSATQQASIACQNLIMDSQQIAAAALPQELTLRQHLSTAAAAAAATAAAAAAAAPSTFYGTASDIMHTRLPTFCNELTMSSPSPTSTSTPTSSTKIARRNISASSTPTSSPIPTPMNFSPTAETEPMPLELVDTVEPNESSASTEEPTTIEPTEGETIKTTTTTTESTATEDAQQPTQTKRNSFSISAILAY